MLFCLTMQESELVWAERIFVDPLTKTMQKGSPSTDRWKLPAHLNFVGGWMRRQANKKKGLTENVAEVISLKLKAKSRKNGEKDFTENRHYTLHGDQMHAALSVQQCIKFSSLVTHKLVLQILLYFAHTHTHTHRH